MTKSESGAVIRNRVTGSQFWFTALWAVFLLFPIAVLLSPLITVGPWLRALGVVAVVVFGVEFIRSVTTTAAQHPNPGSVPPARILRWALLVSLRLAIIAAFAYPALDIGILSLTPYFVAIGLFALPLRWGIPWTAAFLAMMTIWSLLSSNQLFSAAFIGPGIAAVVLIVVRLVDDQSMREQRVRQELAAVHEREAISRDVHDILGHSLTVIALKTQLARRTLRTDPERAEAELDAMLALTQTALDDVRSTVGRLRTPDLAAQLETARTALEDAGVTFVVRGKPDALSPEQRALAAWLIREASTNIIRHAHASECTVTFTVQSVSVVDNGRGFAADEGHGLTGLRRRIEEAGGELLVTPAYPHRAQTGTRLEMVMP